MGGHIDSPNPIILPRKDELTDKLLRKVHEENAHSGPLATHHETRKRVWILAGGVAARSVVRNCGKCKRRFKPCGSQIMGPLPPCRLKPSYPFETTGVDYAGPYVLKARHGRATVKRWICLFTCYRCRAIHIEVAENLTSDAFIKCLLRFCARRPGLKHLYSDLGSNFVSADRIMKEHFESWRTASSSTLERHGIIWHYSAGDNPEYGGAFERMVGVFKRAFGGITNKADLSLEAFHTYAVVVEGIVNARPLLPVPSETLDREALSPQNFLSPGAKVSSSLDILPPTEETRIASLGNSYKLCLAAVGYFWKRWVGEYISSLQKRNKWTKPSRNLKVGDVVLISGPTTP